jgi:hypothetical protein
MSPIIFTTLIRSYHFNLSVMLILHLNLKYLKFIKCFRLFTYGVNITIVREIISEGND